MRTAPSPLPTFLALENRQIPFICTWLDVQSLGLLDMAVSSSGARKLWLQILKSIACKSIDTWRHSHTSIRWAILRSILLTQILVDHKHRDKLSDLTFEAVGINRSTTSYGEERSNDGILSIWGGCEYLKSANLSNCQGITDI